MIINNDVLKTALKDKEFRKIILEENIEFQSLLSQWIQNPDCECNQVLYQKLYENTNILKKYFKDFEIKNNDWNIFNGNIKNLEDFLRSLDNRPKQICAARYKNQITVIIRNINN